MTVSSVLASVAPSAPAARDGAAAPEHNADTGFASMLAGIHDRAAANATKPREQAKEPSAKAPESTPSKAKEPAPKPPETRAHAEKAPAEKTPEKTPEKTAGTPTSDDGASVDHGAATDPNAPADPVTVALLAALAGGAPRTPLTDTPPPPTDLAASTAGATETTAGGAGPLAPTPAAATDPATTASALADAAAANTALPVPTPPAKATTTDKNDTAPTADSPQQTDTSSRPVAPNPAAPKPTAPPAAPVTAATNAIDAATVATATTAIGSAATTAPAVHAEPASKSATGGDNAMIAAAQANVERAPAPEAAAAVKAAAAPTAPPPAPPAEQLAAVIRPLQRGADGSYQLNIELRPAELGRVDMRVEMRDGVIHASIHTEHPQTAELVRNALDDLRSRLDADGVRSGQLTVDSQGAGSSGRDTQTSTRERLDDGPATAPEPPVVVAAPTQSSDSLLDVRI